MAYYIKLTHSLLFFIIGISTVYALYAVVFGELTTLAWIAFGVAATEMLVLLFNNWTCPLTVMAEEQGAKSGSVADVFLPKWLSDHLFQIFTVVFVLTCLLLIERLLPY